MSVSFVIKKLLQKYLFRRMGTYEDNCSVITHITSDAGGDGSFFFMKIEEMGWSLASQSLIPLGQHLWT